MARTVPLVLVIPALVLPALVLPALVLQACCRSAAAAEQQRAVEVFRTFQEALFRGDGATVRRLLTRKSRRFTKAIQSRPLTGREPLEVLRTDRVRHQLRVHVKDPNDANRESFFVLVREDGSIRVDLVATTAYNKREHRRPGPREVVRQKRLTRREIERIRAVAQEAIR